MKHACYLIALIVSFISCSNTAKGDSHNEQKSINIERIDKDLYNYLENPTKEKETALYNKYPTLLPALGYVAIQKDFNKDSADFFSTLTAYYKHPMLLKIYKDALIRYDNTNELEKSLSESTSYLKVLLPKSNIPEFAMHVSGLKENIIYTEDNIVSISIEKYLGKDYRDYQKFFEKYQLQQMQPQMIVRDYLKACLYSINKEEELTNSEGRKSAPNLLSKMIHEGKQLYILSLLLPDYQSYDLIGYTPEQLEWCKKNEKAMWQLFAKQNRLFSTDYQPIANYLEDAPYTPGFSTESPGRVGQWIGWQIVKAYIKKTNASVQQLIDNSSQNILKDSKYNP